MSVDRKTNQVDRKIDQEQSLFVATPVWERSGKKRRTFGGSRVTSRPAVAPTAVEASQGEPAPAIRRTAPKKQSSAATASAIALGVIVVAGAGAAGWYALQDRDTGVAQLTPGEPATAAGPAGTTQVAANTVAAPAAVTPAPATVTPARTTTRVRPAAVAAATGSSVDTSATLPEGPIPYAQSNPDAARMAPNPTTPAAIPAEPVTITPPAATSAADPATVNPPEAAAAPVPAEPPAIVPPPQ